MMKKINTALISVFYKDGLEPIIRKLVEQNVTIYSTGGTQKFIEKLGFKVEAVENLTSYPSILGGRVKTLHPKVFGGILRRDDHSSDLEQINQYEIPTFDLVMVDLYPFEETLLSQATEEEIIEKIDIGGIALIRAAAKNFRHVLTVSSRNQYPEVLTLLTQNEGQIALENRKKFAQKAFAVSSHYDTAIFNYFLSADGNEEQYFKQSIMTAKALRYGENPHQKGVFYGNLDEAFEQANGKELSYNNLVDIDAAVALIDEFQDLAFAILKHTNACGLATGKTVKEAYLKALQADPVSAFGGVLITNREVDMDVAKELDKLFLEVLIAPSYTNEALQMLKSKKNRILLIRKDVPFANKTFKTLLNGVIEQDKDGCMECTNQFKVVTQRQPTNQENKSLEFALKLAKHTKSNTIVLAKEGQLFASGVGQTSRIDALQQAIAKARHFGFDLQEAVMASDAFFPFPDCVEIAHQEGIKAVIQPGGSIKDQLSIDYCDANNMAMVFTGVRHFKH